MNDFLIIQEFLEEILSEHYIEAQVIYQLLEMEEDIRHSTLTYIYRVILVEKIPGETIQYINVEININPLNYGIN